MSSEPYWTAKDVALVAVVTSVILGVLTLRTTIPAGVFLLGNIGLALLGAKELSWEAVFAAALGLVIAVVILSTVVGPAVGGAMLWRRRPKAAMVAALFGLVPSALILSLTGALT